MATPQAIVDALESVLDIFFSNIRHRERAAFILCDNLVEMACKTRAVEFNYRFNTSCGFYDAWNAPGVALPARGLGGRVQDYRNVRNNMQHASAAATVDTHYCADAILDCIRVIDRCWPGTSKRQYPPRMQCAVRIVKLYSSDGDISKRDPFEKRMQIKSWRSSERESVRPNGKQIEPGVRDYWGIAIRYHTTLVEECLNELEIL